MLTSEEAYNNYLQRVQLAKEQLVKDFEEVLKSVGMYNVYVVHKKTGDVGKFRVVVPKTPGKSPEIQFFRCLSNGKLSKMRRGHIPYFNTEEYLKDLYRVWKPKNEN